MTDEMPRVLIEDWLPIEALGAESKRERGASSALPPLYFLHVWWARRPLIASRAAILAGVLPQWSPKWPDSLLAQFPDRESYQAWFMHLLGILGDPVAARKRIDYEKSLEIRTPGDKYGYPRAFSRNPSTEDLETLHALLRVNWSDKDVSILDPFAGGGSIPFEALRYGFTTLANELNPVAYYILRATLDYPARFGPSLARDIRKWGKRWHELVKPMLAPYFAAPPGQPDRSIYMWARSVPCPVTEKPVPLAPNWWISRGSNPIAVRLLVDPSWEEPRFEIARGADIDFDPDIGTLSRGSARSPWTSDIIESNYIKREAQAGRMGEVLYCMEVHTPSGKEYVAPTDFDRELVKKAQVVLMQKRGGWIARDVVPNEPFPPGNDNRPLMYGMPTWSDFFSPRQLLAMGSFVEALRELENELRATVEKEKAEAIIAYCGSVLNKCPNYNSRLSSWIVSRGTIRSVFDRHDFSFKWTFVEFNALDSLLPWAVGQVVDAYRGIAQLTAPAQLSLLNLNTTRSVDRLSIAKGSAASMMHIPDGSVHNITVDPPYYDNVQYAELSDFFYVWLKRSVGHLFPEFFTDALTNKDDEAVANPGRFDAMGRKKTQLAEQDYERKMGAAFREMHRVLHPHGVLTVMFTHKRVEAWDTLATALISAGFTIKASWPVHTEFEHSLHQAKKNAAASTILLVCRKRTPSDDGAVWWDDLQGQVRRVAREKALEYAAQGVGGVDLYISTFGPTLSVISENWPVLTSEIDPKTGQPRPLRPDTALDLAREEVIRLRKEGLLAGKAIEFDPVTDWYLMAWDAFQAEQFPYDEARKLALALGLEVDDTLMRAKRLVTKKGQYVVLQEPGERRRKGMVDPDAAIFEHWIDALHTAMMIYDEDGAGACDVFLMNRGLKQDTTFKAGLQALINTIPRTKIKGTFVRPEADVLDRMRLAFYADEFTVPPEEEPELPRPEQLGLNV
jgi:adenine-specific DNA methylase